MNNLMWILLISFMITTIMAYITTRDFGDSIFTGAIISLVLGICMLFILIILFDFPSKIEIIKQSENPIHSIKDDNSGIQGSFFLGSGSIGTSWYYASYVEKPDGFIKEKYKQDITYINETDSTEPKVEKYIKRTENNKIKIFLLGPEKKYRISNQPVKYILYVPKIPLLRSFI